MKSVGLVLSGGGARGIAHLGVLTALEELNIQPTAISGVSAGAMVGALYASGIKPEDILHRLKDLYDFRFTDFSWLSSRVRPLNGVRKMMERVIKHNDFAHLQIPLFVTATDVSRGNSITFSEGNLIDLVIASSSIPAMVDPVPYMDYQLLDGGLLNNLPVEPLAGKFDVLIGSHVNKLYDGITPMAFSRLSLVDQCFHMAVHDSVAQRAAARDVFIEPLMAGIGMFDVKEADRLFAAGYRETMTHKDKLLTVLES